jgi:hypothetical protein
MTIPIPKPVPALILLPAEIQNQILSELSYPDLLSLKLTHPHFYFTIKPTLYDRVDWLLDRIRLKLPIPQAGKCSLNLRTDIAFYSNPEVGLILRRRWKHLECVNNGGQCREVPGQRCQLRWGKHACQFGIWDRLCNCELQYPLWKGVWFASIGAAIAAVISVLV